MASEHGISLSAFLLNPRAGLHRLNGWQRIWLVLTGLLVVLHGLVGFFLMPNLSKTRFNAAEFEYGIGQIQKWQRENAQVCKAAHEEVRLAQLSNTEYNAKEKAKADALRVATQARIDADKARLFAIETSGGKFSSEWSRYDNSIEAHSLKLREQRWIPRSFNEAEMVNAESAQVASKCSSMEQLATGLRADMDTARQGAASAREDIASVVLGTLISLLCFTFGAYLIGWCAGWIRGGFKSLNKN